MWVLVGSIALIVALVTGGVIVRAGAKAVPQTAQVQPVNTVKVAKGRLTATVFLDGILTYRAQADGSPYAVIGQASGTATWLPAVGRVIEQGQALFRVDGEPVVLLYGATPAYRTLAAGMTGADVAALNAALVALGYATAAELPADTDHFTPATATALQGLQSALDLPQTGFLPHGQAVFMPGAVRVTAVSATLGGPLRPGQPMLQSTSTTRVVTIALDAARQSEVKAGDRVVIILPDGSTTPGIADAVGTVATTPEPAGGGGGNVRSPPTIAVEVQPTDQGATGGLDQAPVRVSITTRVVENALSVPVTALLGNVGGGFAVEVVRADGRRELVATRLGLFDPTGGRVQVEGELREGDLVVVPTP
jgi:hypothetical protein